MAILPGGGGGNTLAGIPVDNTDLADQKIPKYNSATGNIEYETDSGAGGQMATQAEAEAGTLNTVYMSPLRTAQSIAALASAGTAPSIARTFLFMGS